MSWFEVSTILIFWLIVWYRWLCYYRAPITVLPLSRTKFIENPPLVSIIVAARNEEKNISRCVNSLLSQNYSNCEIIAVNDCSDDSTGTILDELAKIHPKLKVIHGKPLPESWMGKAHAMYQGYQAAQGEWLLFTDADTFHAPSLLPGVMAAVLPTSYSFATMYSKTANSSFGTYFVSLAVNAYIFMVSDPRNVMNPKSRQSLVNGHYMLFTREAYELMGTHKAIKNYSIDDVALGYLTKMKGFIPLVMMSERDDLHVKHHRTFWEAFCGWSSNLIRGLWTALGPGWGSFLLLAFTLGLFFFWVVPWLTWLGGLETKNSAQTLVGFSQIIAGFAVLWLMKGKIFRAFLDLLLMPFSFLLFIGMVFTGLTIALFQGGSSWKGRVTFTRKPLPSWNPEPTRHRTGPLN